MQEQSLRERAEENSQEGIKEKGARIMREEVLFPVNKKGRHVSKTENLLRAIVVPFLRLIYPFRYYGNTKIPDGGVLFVGNHYTVFDIVYPGMLTKEGVHFFTKSSLFSHKFLGWFCRKCRVIPVNRDGKDVKGLLQGIHCLKSGDKVSLYPEGTRNKTQEEMLPFHSGSSMMAIKARAKIIPIAIYKKQRPFVRTHILVGEPFELVSFYEKRLTEDTLKEADEVIKNKILSLRAEHKKLLEEKKGKKQCK